VEEHQTEKRPEGAGEGEAQHGQAAHELAEGEEFFRGEIAVGELVAEEHAGDGRRREGAENAGLLRRRKTEGWQIAINERQPRAPDEKFQHHHEEKFEAVVALHLGWRNLSLFRAGPQGKVLPGQHPRVLTKSTGLERIEPCRRF